MRFSKLIACMAFSVLFVCSNLQAKDFHLSKKYGVYQWSNAVPVAYNGKTLVTFYAKTVDDIYITLATERSSSKPRYEIIVGGWGNSRTVVRDIEKGREVVRVSAGSNYQNVVTPNENTAYWLLMDHGRLILGKGSNPGTNTIFNIPDSANIFNRIRYLTFSSWGHEISFSNLNVRNVNSHQTQTNSITSTNQYAGNIAQPKTSGNYQGSQYAMPATPTNNISNPATASTAVQLVGEYLFDSVSDLDDSSGEGTKAILHGKKGSSGAKRSTPFVMTAQNKRYLEIPLNDNNRFTENSFSVSFWVKTSLQTSNPRGIVTDYMYSTSACWSFPLGSNGGFTFVIRNKNRVASSAGFPNGNDGQWHHIVGIRDRENQEIRFYVDGKLVDSDKDIPGSVDSGQSIWIGNHLNRGFEGSVDDVRLYRGVLTMPQIQSLYRQ